LQASGRLSGALSHDDGLRADQPGGESEPEGPPHGTYRIFAEMGRYCKNEYGIEF
jgi:hypothetical protein